LLVSSAVLFGAARDIGMAEKNIPHPAVLIRHPLSLTPHSLQTSCCPRTKWWERYIPICGKGATPFADPFRTSVYTFVAAFLSHCTPLLNSEGLPFGSSGSDLHSPLPILPSWRILGFPLFCYTF